MWRRFYDAFKYACQQKRKQKNCQILNLVLGQAKIAVLYEPQEEALNVDVVPVFEKMVKSAARIQFL